MTARKYLKQLKEEASNDEKQYDIEDKPSGLVLKPNAIERKIRQEQQDAANRTEQQQGNKKDIFAWLRPDHRGNTGKEQKEPLRSKPLSEKEASEIKPALLAALLDYFRYADEFIYATNRQHIRVSIWGSIDDEDAEVLVDVWLARAKQSAKSASHVVFMVNKHMELRVGIILLPRFYETFRAYVDGGGIGVR